MRGGCRCCRAGAKLINASRGAVVDEPALIAALQSGRIAEATLDVFTVEPLPKGHPFWGMDNVLITPHLASITVPEAAAREVAESIRRVRVRPSAASPDRPAAGLLIRARRCRAAKTLRAHRLWNACTAGRDA